MNDGRASTNSFVVLNANGRDPVDILRTHTDTGDERAKRATVLFDRGLQGGKFIGECIARSPQTEQQRRAGVDGSWDGRDGGVCGAILDHGIKAGRGVAGASQVFGRVEFSLERSLISSGRAVVEALVGSKGGRKGSHEGQKLCGAHDECSCICRLVTNVQRKNEDTVCLVQIMGYKRRAREKK